MIDLISMPDDCNARIEDSRPAPGPLTRTSRERTPLSRAALPASWAAVWAAKGVPFLEPLKPCPPEDAQAISLRGALRLRSNDPDQINGAVQDLEEVVRRLPDNPVLRYRLGDAYVRIGDTHNARLQFNEALARNPEYPLPKYGLMRLLLSRNELTQTTVLADEILEDLIIVLIYFQEKL